MEVRRHGWTLLGPALFVLVIWVGAYVAYRGEHGAFLPPDGRMHVVYPRSQTGDLAYRVFQPLRWLEERYAGSTSERREATSPSIVDDGDRAG